MGLISKAKDWNEQDARIRNLSDDEKRKIYIAYNNAGRSGRRYNHEYLKDAIDDYFGENIKSPMDAGYEEYNEIMAMQEAIQGG